MRTEKPKGWAGVIYTLTNIVNGHVYVGKTTKRIAVQRWREHINDTRNGRSHYIHNAIRVYREEGFKFEVIQCCKTLDTLNKAEIKWIKKKHCCVYDSEYVGGYNLTFGGGGFRGRHSKASRLKISRAVRAACARPQLRAVRRAQMLQRWEDAAFRVYIVEHLNAQWSVPARRRKQAGYMAARNVEWWKDETYRAEKGAASKLRWEDEAYKKFMSKAASKGRRAAFADPYARATWLISRYPHKYAGLLHSQVVMIASEQIERKKHVIPRASSVANKERRQREMRDPKNYAEFLVRVAPHKYGADVMSFRRVMKIASEKIKESE